MIAHIFNPTNILMRFLFLLLCFAMLAACGKKNRQINLSGNPPVRINASASSAHLSLASVIDSIWYVSLQISDSTASIGRIDKILLLDHKIYIVDVRMSSVKAYDLSGKYLFDVGHLGFKKGEYRKVIDIAYNKFRNSLYVLCTSPQETIIEFSLSGEYIRNIKLEYGATGVGIEKDNLSYYFLNHGQVDDEHYGLAITDSIGNPNSFLFKSPPNINSRIGISGGLYDCNGTFYFNPPLTNTFYSLSDSVIGEQSYYIDFGKDSLPPTFKSLRHLMDSVGRYTLLSKSFVKGSDFVGFSLVDKRHFKQIFYNTKSGHIAMGDSTNIINSLLNYDVFQSHDTIMTATYLNELRYKMANSKPTDWVNLPGIYESAMASEKGNHPIIIFYKLKSF
jgi:hypothetical protein